MSQNRNTRASLKHRVVRAGTWSLALHGGEVVFNLVRTVVLARLLAPNDFGLFGIAVMAMMALDFLTRTGFEQALVQRRGDIGSLLDVAWSVQLLRGFALFGLLFAAAPLVSVYFEAPEALGLLRIIGLCLVLQGATNSAVVMFQRNLEFHKEFVFRFSGIAVDLLVSVTAALALGNAWALLFGMVANHATRLAASYLAHPYRPRFRIDGKSVKSLFNFGKWMLLTGILLFVGTRGPDVVLAKLVGVTGLGLFLLAGRIPRTVLAALSNAINGVAFPTYASLAHDRERMAEIYLKIAGCSCMVIMPVVFGLLAVGRDFTGLFLGEQWLPMVDALTILTLAAGLNGLRSTGRPVFLGLGRPQVLVHMQSARVAGLALLLVPLTLWWGIAGAALAVLLSRICGFVVFYVNVTAMLPLCGRDLLRMLLLPLSAALGMYVTVALIGSSGQSLVPTVPAEDMTAFLLRVGVGALAYTGLMLAGFMLLPRAHPLRGAAQTLMTLKREQVAKD